jgi:enamine deaminase RidA (YjgF/YER057c/UK114 family)
MSSTSGPPRFVPTLTDVVQTSSYVTQINPAHQDQAPNQSQLEDQVVHRVMQRVDLVLERRLREAVAQVILTHTQSLGPRLREEIELVVRESVMQAVAQELPQQPG